MSAEILLVGTDGQAIILEANGGNTMWSSKMPVRTKDIEVQRFHLEDMSGDTPLVIVTTLDPSINCPAQETGTWSINGYGGTWRLEYVTESLNGRPTPHSNIFQWDIAPQDVNQAM